MPDNDQIPQDAVSIAPQILQNTMFGPFVMFSIINQTSNFDCAHVFSSVIAVFASIFVFSRTGRIPIRQIFHTVQRQIEAVAGKTIVDLYNFPYFDHDPQKFRCTFSLRHGKEC